MMKAHGRGNMNTEKLLNYLAWAIANRPCPENVICQVGVAGDRVVCLPRWNSYHDFQPVAELTPRQMNKGLTSAQWSQLGEKLAAVLNGVRNGAISGQK